MFSHSCLDDAFHWFTQDNPRYIQLKGFLMKSDVKDYNLIRSWGVIATEWTRWPKMDQ